MRSTSSTARAVKRKARPKSETRRGPGRPTRYTAKIAVALCARLAEGESLRAICKEDAMPALRTVMGWLFDSEHGEFSKQYASAREAQAEGWADEIVSIADDATGDVNTDDGGKKTVDHENIERSRLRVDARKWVASKLLPKRYGDKVQHTGEGGGPIPQEHRLAPELHEFIERILGRAAKDKG